MKIAIVTGASSGIGLGITQALLLREYAVVATSRNASKAGVPSALPVLIKGGIDAGKWS